MATVKQAVSLSRVNVPLVDTGWRVGMPHGINRPVLEPIQTHTQAVRGAVEITSMAYVHIRCPRNPALMRRVWFSQELRGYGVFGK